MKILVKIGSFFRKTRLLWGGLLIFLLSFAFRNYIAERDLRGLESATGCRFAPFLVESAIMYSYMNDFADGKNIAGKDERLPAMQNESAAEQMSLSLEYAGGIILKLRRAIYGTPQVDDYERSYEESRFIRKCFTWYLALVPLFIFLALIFMRVPWSLAFLAAAAQVFSAAALGRYTGQDLIKGAFALPFLSAYIMCYAAVLYKKVKIRRIALTGAMITAAAATASWDASGMIIGLLALSEIIFSVISGSASCKKRDFYLVTFIAMTVTMLLTPYSLKHGTVFSPVMQFAIPAAAAVNMMPAARRRIWQLCAIVLLALWSIAAAKISPFAGNYGHFSELLSAKLKFGNVLPSDPSLLTFDQRYLWTPELHSATWQISKLIYPAALPLALILLAILLIATLVKKIRKQPLATIAAARLKNTLQFALLTVIWLVMYIYFMRFRDMTMLFGILLLGTLGGYYCSHLRNKKGVYYLLLVLFAAVCVLECRSACRLKRGYPQGLSYTAEMLKYLRAHDLTRQTVLTDMQNSTLLKGYTDASILIQAKYELPSVRLLTQDYLNKFFNASLDEFTEFCAQNKVDYLLIHLPMITTPSEIPYSYRYMVCADKLRNDSAAVQLGIRSGNTRNFYEITLPPAIRHRNGYRLYKFTPPEQVAKAEKLADTAWKNFRKNPRSKKARRQILRAYRTAPGMSGIYEKFAFIRREVPPEITLKKRSQR